MPSLGLNTSIIAIPAYYILCFLPHLYANFVGSRGNLSNLEYSNPRSAKHVEGIKAKISPSDYARFERARAASANAYENAPLLIAAVLASHIAGLDKGRINTYAIRFLLARTAHSVFYISIPGPKYYQLRSTAWMVSLYLSFSILYEAAKALV